MPMIYDINIDKQLDYFYVNNPMSFAKNRHREKYCAKTREDNINSRVKWTGL